ncbi:MAG: recombinase family protein [Pseudorhodoplanes sp.]|uniref:recombinase family protein n=1 Tax=Pseudorhodoplanes sp. TaxID=1934341 RepID=UPI003D116402
MADANYSPRRSAKRSRCAVYTRKSTEEGLEQDFNSLDAQREACAAFVQSQKQEGWILLPTTYDDGGYSGGSLERPALQRLLADIEAGRIDVVVVYKVDRLTRALSDFAKLVEVFDRRGVSFVSITQQFNTTTSMGRLTLNILLSFAQFERELIGERVRDKVAASRKKGIWMGGIVPLGYDVKDRKLVVNKAEARTVVDIYRRYLRVKSVNALRAELDAAGIKSKRRVRRDGSIHGNQSFSQGALYLLLQNRTYRGEAKHKGNAYPGEHTAIIDKPLWDAVQSVLAENRVERAAGVNTKAPSLLTGLLFDEAGERLTPTWSIKKGTRYRYYVSTSLVKGGRKAGSTRRRIPAGDLENVVIERIRKFLSNRGELLDAIEERDRSQIGHRHLIERGRQLAKELSEPPEKHRPFVLSLVPRVEIGVTHLSIYISQSRLMALLDANHMELRNDHAIGASDPVLTLTTPIQLARVGEQMKLLVEDKEDNREPDMGLLRVLARAYDVQRRLCDDPSLTVLEIARREQITSNYLYVVLRLRWLAPDIVTAIVNGRQPPQLSTKKLMRLMAKLPADWEAQRSQLGFR